MTTAEFQVGSIVRLSRGDKRTGRATISTIDDDDQVSLFWEDAAPLPVEGSSGFIVTPLLPGSSDDNELTISKSELQRLLPFELSTSPDENNPSVWKERGDTILKLGDASSSIPYYERALQLTSRVQVGSTILIMRKDAVVAAEVDCLDDDTADVTYVESNDEAVVQLKSIRLAISMEHVDLQIRVLLNLARALLQVADFDNSQLSRPSLYRDGAILACSLAHGILLTDEAGEMSPFLISTLFLRSKAHAGRAKWQASLSDVDRLLKLKPQSKEGRTWRKELLGLIAQSERANKKLVKSMCRWIQSTTQDGAPVSEEESETSSIRNDTIDRTDSHSWLPGWFTGALFAMLVALWMCKSTPS
ncbi:hypothetical protein MHU86_9823 [Fragilaria crotonensis]|nr:hypothetical protein MHU86_9823 [Fragilaria crotonensis]